MNINQLRIFISVAQTLNFTRSARLLYISESTVSKNIAKLENELQVKLFERKAHHLILTSEGVYFFKKAKKITNELDIAIANLKKKGNQYNDEITIGVTNIAFELAWLPLAIKICKQRKINLNLFSFTPGTAPNLSNLITNHDVDILMLQSDYLASHQDINSTKFFEKGFSVVVNQTDPLSQLRKISFSDLIDRNLLVWDSDFTSPIIENLKLSLSKLDFLNKPVLLSDYYQLITQVRADNYTGIVPSLMYDNNNRDLAYVPLDYPEKIEYCANYLANADNMPVIQKCLKIINYSIQIIERKW